MDKEENSNSSQNQTKQVDLTELRHDLRVPVVRLSNGVVVANFSSPHSFEFTDGTILPACSLERANLLALDSQEIEMTNGDGQIHFVDIVLNWGMSETVRVELLRISKIRGYHILLIPLAVMTAVKAGNLPIGRCRCIRRVRRGSDVIHTDRFCI